MNKEETDRLKEFAAGILRDHHDQIDSLMHVETLVFKPKRHRKLDGILTGHINLTAIGRFDTPLESILTAMLNTHFVDKEMLKITSYAVIPPDEEIAIERLVLFIDRGYSDQSDKWARLAPIQKLPFSMNVRTATLFIRQWLEQVNYGPGYDTDGDCDKGYLIYNDGWRETIIVEPEWIIYGK